MATPQPALASQVIPDANMTLTVPGGGTASLATTRYYYYVSNRTTASSGQSLLHAIKLLVDTSGSVSSTVTLTSAYKLTINTNAGTPTGAFTWGSSWYTQLGFASATPTMTAGVLTADYVSSWLWSPQMSVSETGPQLFDPAISYGVPVSAGSAQRSSDGTAGYTKNGVRYAAQYVFRGVEGLYLVRAQSGYTNQDWETFWKNNVSAGRRLLLWRDRTNLVGSASPSEGSATPYNYVEYQPSAAARENMLAVPVVPPRLSHWDVTWDLWDTENGETPLTD